MNKRLGLFVLALFCLPMSAFSSIINIEYSGYINNVSGDGFGYSLGDVVKGSALIDLSKIEGHNFELSDGIWVYGAASGELLRTSNYTGGYVGDTINLVDIHNGSAYNSDSMGLAEVLSIEGSVSNSFHLNLRIYGLDWITDNYGSNINLVTDDAALLSQSTGGFGRQDMTDWSLLSSAGFQLDSLKVISANVPEPTPFILLSLGLLGIVVRRKLH